MMDDGGNAGDVDDGGDVRGGVRGEAAASFSLRSDSLKLMLMAVSAIVNGSGKKDQFGVVKVGTMGVRILVETAAKSMQAHVFINRDRLTVFNLEATRGEHTEIAFRVNLVSLLDCLSLFGASAAAMTSLAMSFSEEDAVLHVLLEMSGIVTECDLATVDVDAASDYEDVFR